MKNILKFLVFCTFFSSCKDPMELKSPINKHLDSEIAHKLLQLASQKGKALTPMSADTIDPDQIDNEIRKMGNSINLYDASTKVMEKADKYFRKYTGSHLVKKGEFIEITSLDDKREVILALKLNELVLLDRLLYVGKK